MFWIYIFKTTREFKKIDEVDDAKEKMKTNKIYLKHGQLWFS